MLLTGGGKVLIPRRLWLVFGIALAAVSCVSYLYGRTACRGEQRRYQLTHESLEEVASAKNLLLRVRKLQDLLDRAKAEAAAAGHSPADDEGAAPAAGGGGKRPKQAKGVSEAEALLSELQELKAAINARHAGHAAHGTHTPGAGGGAADPHTHAVPAPAVEEPVVVQPAIPHASHVHSADEEGAGHHHGHGHGDGPAPAAGDGHAHAHAHAHAHTHTHAGSVSTQTPGVVPKGVHEHALNRVNEVPLTTVPEAQSQYANSGKTPTQQCQEWATKYHVKPGLSWGHLTTDLMAEWTILDCDHWVGGRPKQAKAQALPASWAVSSVLETGESGAEIIAVCIAVCTRGIKSPAIERLALFRSLLPSFTKTAAPGFEYRIYVAYDVGDAWFDVSANRDSATIWFAEHVGLPLASASGVNATLFWHRFQNDLHKPGPVFNAMTRAAYRDGAHWIYRINDDSILDTPWAVQLTGKLKSFGRPFGAVGPWCTFGNTAILTHDMTHRTHMQIFDELYYPAELNDWWMDDWITRVYGRSRTRRMKDVVVTHQSEHGTRYHVDHSHGRLVDGLIAKGREKVVAWMKAQNYPQAVIDNYQGDTSEFSVLAG